MTETQSSASTKPLAVGVTGHRDLGEDCRVHWYVQSQCVLLLERLRVHAQDCGTSLITYSALAIGADQLFAQAAIGLGIPLVGVVPFEAYAEDFEEEDRHNFERLLQCCSKTERLPRKKRSDQAYLKAGTWMVDRCDFLVAVWDGQPAKGVGGTADIVAYAKRKCRRVLQIGVKPLTSLCRDDVER